MKKLTVCVLLAMMIALLFVPSARSEEPLEFGRFVVIRADTYEDLAHKYHQYIVYDKQTLIVYIYTVGARVLEITPYLMRNVYGELTVGIYDVENGVIKPMEPYTDEDGYAWIITG